MENELIREVQDDLLSDDPRLIYADWLEERGRIEAKYLRTEMELARFRPSDWFRQQANLQTHSQRLDPSHQTDWDSYLDCVNRLQMLSNQIDSSWIATIGLPMDVALLTWGQHKLECVKRARSLARTSLMITKLFVESAPIIKIPALNFVQAIGAVKVANQIPSREIVNRSERFRWCVQLSGILPFRLLAAPQMELRRAIENSRIVNGIRPLIPFSGYARLCCIVGRSPIHEEVGALQEAGFDMSGFPEILREFNLQNYLSEPSLIPVPKLMDRAEQIEAIRRVQEMESVHSFVFLAEDAVIE